MKNIFTIMYWKTWTLGVNVASHVCKGDGTRTMLWIDFRWPWEHTANFHRLRIPLSRVIKASVKKDFDFEIYDNTPRR